MRARDVLPALRKLNLDTDSDFSDRSCYAVTSFIDTSNRMGLRVLTFRWLNGGPT
jgi:hypothetical protein